MRSLEELAVIRDRVLAEIRANPSQRPYLTEMYADTPGPKPETDAATVAARQQQRAEYKRRWRQERAH